MEISKPSSVKIVTQTPIGNLRSSTCSSFQIAAEIAAPLSQAKKISMVSDGTGEIGAAKLTGEVLQIMQSVPGLVKNLTGVDITAQVGGRGGDLRSRVSTEQARQNHGAGGCLSYSLLSDQQGTKKSTVHQACS